MLLLYKHFDNIHVYDLKTRLHLLLRYSKIFHLQNVDNTLWINITCLVLWLLEKSLLVQYNEFLLYLQWALTIPAMTSYYTCNDFSKMSSALSFSSAILSSSARRRLSAKPSFSVACPCLRDARMLFTSCATFPISGWSSLPKATRTQRHKAITTLMLAF